MDNDFAAALKALGALAVRPKPATALEYRANTDAFVKSITKFPFPADVTSTKFAVKSYDGADVDIFRYQPADVISAPGSLPALIYLHGGGVVACGVEAVSGPQIAKFALQCGVQVFAVEYRMAPEHPYPTPLEDCYAALLWLSSHAQEFSIDASRIGVMGESGGALLTAGVTLLARDRNFSPPIARQLLVYPMLDDRSPSNLEQTDPRYAFLKENAMTMQLLWDSYLSDLKSAGNEIPAYASPMRSKDLSGLPSAYVEVGSLDVFRDESLAYAAKLLAARVDTEFHLYVGVPHVFDVIAPDIPISKNAKDNRIRIIRKI